MFTFIQNFFSGSWARIKLTALEIQYALIIVGIMTIIGVLPPFLGTPVMHSFYLAVPIAIFSIYRLCGLSRYFTTHITGEVAEISVDVCDKNFQNQSLLDNELAATYRKLIVFVLIAQSSIFILAAVAFNYLDGSRVWLPAMITIFFLISLWAPRFSIWTFGMATTASIIFIFAIAIHDMVPSVSRIPGVSQVIIKIKNNEIASENARALEDIGVFREKQRQLALSEVIGKIARWQKENPVHDIPEELKMEMEAAKNGLSLGEYKVRNAPKEEVLAAIENALRQGRKLEELDPYCQKIWRENQIKLAEEKATAEKVATEKATVQAIVQAPPVVQPMVQFIDTSFEDGPQRNRVVLKSIDAQGIEFVQIWTNGHEITFRGKKVGGCFVGLWSHDINGGIKEGRFSLNPTTLKGRSEQPGNINVPFRLI